MLARHAEALFWAGRYLERAEDTARLLDVTYHGLLEAAPEEEHDAWSDLLEILGVPAPGDGRSLTAATVSEFLTLDHGNPSSIVTVVGRARENARGVRELLSTELWEAVNTFFLELQARDLRADLAEQPYQLYGMVKRRCQGVSGVASETMTRDDAWRFLMLGWVLERAEVTCRLLQVRYGDLVPGDDPPGFHALVNTLKSASALQAFRTRYGASLDPANAVELLLLARDFPRSVLFCLAQAEAHLDALGPAGGRTRPQRRLGRVRSDLEYADVRELFALGIHRCLDEVHAGVREVAGAIGEQFFRSRLGELHPLDFHPLSPQV